MFSKFKREKLHPEFIQDDVNPKNIIEAFENFNTEKFLQNSKDLRAYLKHGSSKTVAKMTEEEI
jgi:lipid-A-disaccharide synthase